MNGRVVFFLFFFLCFGRPSIAKVFSHNCSFGCVRLGCIPECQEALFRDRGIKSCRDILRRSLNPGGPPRRSCESSSVSGLVVFNQKLNKCSARASKRNDSLFFFILFFLTPEVDKRSFTPSLRCPPERARRFYMHEPFFSLLLLLACPVETRQKFPAEKINRSFICPPPRSTLSRISIRARGEICLPPPTPFFFVPSSQNALLTDQSHFRPGVVTGLTICAHCCAE